jgi:hypothetical protein
MLERCARHIYAMKWDNEATPFENAHPSDRRDCHVTAEMILRDIYYAEFLDRFKAILTYEPHGEICYDEFAYWRIVEAYREVARAALAKAGVRV